MQRDFFKTRFSRCILYRHNNAIGTDLCLIFWDNSLYIFIFKKVVKEKFKRKFYQKENFFAKSCISDFLTGPLREDIH